MLRDSKELAVVLDTRSRSEFSDDQQCCTSITARLRLLPTPSCTYCAVASHDRAQRSCTLKHLINNLIAHLLLAGSNLLPAHSKNVEFFNYTHHLAQ